jgi:hypothetical protein
MDHVNFSLMIIALSCALLYINVSVEPYTTYKLLNTFTRLQLTVSIPLVTLVTAYTWYKRIRFMADPSTGAELTHAG